MKPTAHRGQKCKFQSVQKPKVTSKLSAHVTLGYDHIMKTGDYHIIHGKGDEVANYQIVPNTTQYKERHLVSNRNKNLNLAKYSSRPPLLNTLNENRFENINKDPSIFSKTMRVANFKFDRLVGRGDLENSVS